MNYDYNLEQVFKLISKYQCIKLIKCIALNYKISTNDINTEIENITKQINNLKVNYIFNKVKPKIKKHNKIPKASCRCQARVFNYHNIISKSKSGKIIYGTRCKRPKQNKQKYCIQHNNNLTHGNYLQEPNDYLKHHFLKEYQLYIKKEKPDISSIITVNL